MKSPLLFVQDPNALKNWLTACGTSSKGLYDLVGLAKNYNQNSYILLIQISENSTIEQIIDLAQHFDIIAFSNNPNDLEGVKLFQNGIKGYVNTFATVERIKQVLSTVNAGSIWLGQSVMQAMIGAVAIQNHTQDSWKERLTDREIQTTELVLQSKTNKIIANELNITERTVKAHLHNTFEKFNVTDRLALVLKIKNWS